MIKKNFELFSLCYLEENKFEENFGPRQKLKGQK